MCVQLTGGELERDVVVTLSTQDGSATSGGEITNSYGTMLISEYSSLKSNNVYTISLILSRRCVSINLPNL